jgi:hypothetical protein
MKNPWEEIAQKSTSGSFVLESDKAIIDAFNNASNRLDNHKIHLELLPEPFLGNPNAGVVLLNLNPGFNNKDEKFHTRDNYFQKQSLMNLIHHSNCPFYLLDEKLKDSPGYIWWSKRLKRVIEQCNDKSKITKNLLSIELFPYHSKRFKEMPPLPSQKYTKHLVEQAIKRQAIIILIRSRKRWLNLIPELGEYQNFYSLKNPRCAYISPKNLPDAFELVVNAINRG